ncbi:alpha/beta fold hydrolase [Halococcus hamelinensis]|uniref:Alpha/beta hydrolase n=1 Tax=Halococcus hamelinensis 100A6 TaxID=1132509 RepID=M0MAZ0_9EURY|nr:alpha/beta hydrolase [Halococcus hamelinensis]EMA41545.1 alpha/beta hydrolase [Halococcus hamelinensis 100A6]
MNLPERWTTETVSANGVGLQCYRTGSGPPILMAHGLYDNGRRWLPLGSDLADDFEVIAYDARGHGRSDAPETGYDIDTRVSDLVALVEELGLENPTLLGHSMGAATVAWAATTHPDLPRGLVLEDPARFRDLPDVNTDETRERAREHLRERQARPVEKRVAEYDDAHDTDHVRRLAESIDECHPNAVKVAEDHPPVAEAFESITCPTLVFRRDLGIEERRADLDVATRLRDGRLVHVPDAGHYVFLDEYEAASAELRTFLRRVSTIR